MGPPRTDLNLGKKFKQNKTKKNLNFEFLSQVQIYPRNPPFPTTQSLKNYFLYVKINIEFCPRKPKKLFLIR